MNSLLKTELSFQILILTLILFTYFIFSYITSGSRSNFLKITQKPYYNYLTESFLKGKIYVDSPYTYDLSIFNNHKYMYWGPAPVLVVLPFYIIWGIKASDTLYTLIVGSLNVIIFYILLREFNKYFHIKYNGWINSLILISFALSSPNFYLSLQGRIWHTNIVIATFYLLLYLFTLFKFLNQKRKSFYFVLSLIFFSLAWLSRYTLVFYGMLLIYPILLIYKNKIYFHKILKLSVGILGFSVAIFLSYNFARFNNPIETGYKYQIGNERYNETFQKNNIFSLKNIPHNFSVYFLTPAFIYLQKPFIWYSDEGNSIFSVYPLTLYLFFLSKPLKFKNNIKYFLILSFLVLFLNIFILMVNLGTGWVQFGLRYVMDIIPLLFILSLFFIKLIPKQLQYFILIYGILINTIGAIEFYKYFINI